jgi:hypothetical protein
MLKNVALLTECSQYTTRACYFLSGVLDWELLKSHGVNSSHTKHQFFCHKEGIYEKVVGFSVLTYWQF